MKEKVNNGMEHFSQRSGEYGTQALAPIKEHFPELADYILGHAYGDIFQRTTISEQWKEISILSSLIAMGQYDQLGVHYVMAIKVGMTVEEIKGVLLHLAPCVGIPRIISAFHVLLSVLKQP